MIVYLKTEQEIEGFKIAGKITAEILQKVLDSVVVGITTQELDEIARHECRTRGVRPIFLGHEGFPAAICASNNKVLVHGIPDNKQLQQGDILSIDFGAEVDGFIGDTADTIIVEGSSKDELKYALRRSCFLALQNGIKVAKSGNKLSDISSAIYKTAKSFKYSVPVEYGGHGIDRYSMHAPPFVPNIPDEDFDFTLQAGMVIAIEPMLIMGANPKTSVDSDGWSVRVNDLSAHCEHTILVDYNSGIVLTERGGKNE